jgi:hypothetical protein
MKPPPAVPVAKAKKWSKWLKFSGAGLLLFAFGSKRLVNRSSLVGKEAG